MTTYEYILTSVISLVIISKLICELFLGNGINYPSMTCPYANQGPKKLNLWSRIISPFTIMDQQTITLLFNGTSLLILYRTPHPC